MQKDYKITFKNGAAGFPADSLAEAHETAGEYAEGKWYILYERTSVVQGWLRVGDNFSFREI